MKTFIFILLIASIIIPFAFVPIWFVFKCTQKVKLRIFAISFFVPFANLVWFLIEATSCPENIFWLSMFSGAFWLFLILPAIFLITLCIPKKFFKIKWQALFTVFLTSVLGWVLLFSLIPIGAIKNKIFPKPSTSYYNPVTLHKLKDYDSAIKYIENYKKENGVYPKNITSLSIKSENYPYYQYTTYNKDNDFVLYVRKKRIISSNSIYGFRYCSNENLPNCKAIGFENINSYLKIGKWVHCFNSYD